MQNGNYQSYNECVKSVLKDSYVYGMAHIPSALSLLMITYELFKMPDLKDYPLSIGKTFGAQAWFIDDVIRQNYIKSFPAKKILSLSDLTNSQVFGIFTQEQLGIAASHAVGYAIVHRDKKVLCLLSDSDIFFKSTLDAIAIAEKYKLNVTFIVDWNKTQLFGSNDCRDVLPYYDIVEASDLINYIYQSAKLQICLVPTIKGYGCSFMEQDPKAWHYKILDGKSYEKIFG